MTNIKKILDLREIEVLSRRNLRINHMSPEIKVIFTLVYIVGLASIGKYDLETVLLFFIYPIIMVVALDINGVSFFSKLIIPMFFSLGIGMWNPFFDRQVWDQVMGFAVTGGMISFVVVIIKSLLSFSATMLLVATTPLSQISKGLRWLRVPKVFVLLFVMTYRYIIVLGEEVMNGLDAFRLRSGNKKGLPPSLWGPFVGNIVMRSYRRALDIHHAMELRGYKVD